MLSIPKSAAARASGTDDLKFKTVFFKTGAFITVCWDALLLISSGFESNSNSSYSLLASCPWIGSFLERILFIFQSLLNILTWKGLSIFWSLFNILACNCSFTTTDAFSESDSTSSISTTVLGLIVVSMVVVGSKALIVVLMVVVGSTTGVQ
jgi:hypothetical protein